MSTSQKDGDESQVPPKSSQAAILLTLFDTTWRIFMPSIGFTVMGLWFDSKWNTTPWLMLAGAAIGLTVGAFAVKLQLKKFE